MRTNACENSSARVLHAVRHAAAAGVAFAAAQLYDSGCVHVLLGAGAGADSWVLDYHTENASSIYANTNTGVASTSSFWQVCDVT